MALQLILGGCGYGKSHYLYKRIIRESQENPSKNYLVLVPEQFTMETQKDFITMHENHGIMNIDVLSFMRLAYRIMEERGGQELTILEDTGKNMVLRRVLAEHADSFVYFKSNTHKPGFVDEVKSMLSELYQYSIDEEELDHMIEIAKNKPLLEAKLKDLSVIYKGFRDFLSDRYITAEEIMDVLYDALADSNLVKDSVICLDGFTGFTPSQYRVLERLLEKAQTVYVTVTIDPREDLVRQGEDFELFHLSKKTIHKLNQLAYDKGIEVLKPIFPKLADGRPWRFREKDALAALERNLFRYPWEAYAKEQDSILIEEFPTTREEVRFVVRRIRELVRKEGFRYRDFAVVSGDIERYGRRIREEFERAAIPCFLDSKREITKNPLVILINSMLELIRKQMDYESMFHYLRCGMVPFTGEEIDILENYCLAVGIRGKKRWNQPFTRCMRGMEEEELLFLNQLRERVAASLGTLGSLSGGGKHKVCDYVNNLYEAVVSLQAFERLCVMEENFLEQGQFLIAKEYGQVYQLVMEIFERMIELLGEEEVSLLEFQDMLNAGFRKAKVGVIPGGVDQVVIGDIERTRLKDIKVLFFIGVNDGVIPKAADGGGILSDMERELLKERKVELAPTKRERIYTERFYLYLNLTKASHSVYLTYCKMDDEGKAAKASYLIGKIQQLFAQTTKTEATIEDNLECIMEEDGGRDFLLNGLRDFENQEKAEDCWKLIYSWYLEDEELRREITELIGEVYRDHRQDKLSAAVAKALYGEHPLGSVTRLEQFAACACAHFLSYGLRLQERQEFKMNAPDMGNIFHSALELYAKKLKQRNLTWQTIGEEEREQLSAECVREVTDEYGNLVLHSSKRNEYMIDRIQRILNRTLWALTHQISQSEFEPGGYELRFSFLDDLESVRIPLAGGDEMRLTGRIDRVDLCSKEDEIYVKIVDYKSGQKAFHLLDLYYGLELQLVVYMEAMLEKVKKDYPEKTVLPAGIFYYNIDDPLVDRGEPMFREQELLKELRVNGLVNGEPQVVKALDASFLEEDIEELKPSVRSTLIPVETVKSGEFSKNSSVASREEFERMISYVREKMVSFGGEIMAGYCHKNPYKLGQKTACDFCKYGAVCAFDRKNTEDRYRILEAFDGEEVMQRILAEGSSIDLADDLTGDSANHTADGGDKK